jgi:hypothetical protein
MVMAENTFTLQQGHVFHQVDGKLHSTDDKPAVIYADGARWWYSRGKIHRVGGPAIIWANGVEEHWQMGERSKVVYPDTDEMAPQLRGVTRWYSGGKVVKEDLPPKVQRYREMIDAAYKSCFGKGP